MERDCESELSKLNIEQNACIYHFGASVIHGQRSNILRLRNTDETRIVMLDIWQKLYEFDPVLFSPKLTGPFCQRGCCEEGTMSCGIPIPKEWSPLEIMKADYPLLVEGREAVYEN